jgi:ribonuclease Z
MELTVFLLGTSGSIPTPTRSCPAVALRRNGEILLFDCGEGTQVQMVKAGLSVMKISKVFITHLHGDHFLGLAGIVQTLSLWGREKKLEVYCPAEESERLRRYLEIPRYTLTFELVVEGLQPGEEVRGEDWRVLTARASHPVPSLAYAFVEDDRPGHLDLQKALSLGLKPGPQLKLLKAGESLRLPDGRVIRPEDVIGPPIRGRKVVYVGDTSPTEELIEFSKGADLLIFDSTFAEELSGKARENSHSTCVQAAEVARRAGVKKLVLFHISPRYEDSSVLLSQASKIFPETIVAQDLLRIEIAK